MDGETTQGEQPNEAVPETTKGEPANEPVPISEGIARTKQLREGLLAKLPMLAYSSWTVKDDFRLDEELGSAIPARADAVLMPLERLAPEQLA